MCGCCYRYVPVEPNPKPRPKSFRAIMLVRLGNFKGRRFGVRKDGREWVGWWDDERVEYVARSKKQVLADMGIPQTKRVAVEF